MGNIQNDMRETTETETTEKQTNTRPGWERVLAMVGLILFAGLIIATIIVGFFGPDDGGKLTLTMVGLTFVVGVAAYVMALFGKKLKQNRS